MDQAKEVLARAPHPNRPEAVLDYRRILDRQDIDAVVIATTQHWHGIPYIHACQAGKPIYVEKPLSLTVVEGREMLKAARKHGVLTVMGTQQRSGPHYKKAVEIVKSGRLGKIGLVETWNYSDRDKRVGKFPDSEPPPGYHWDKWLGPAKWEPFNEARLQHNWWFDYSGGVLTNWGPHHFDIVLWAMGQPDPKSVMAMGGKLVLDDAADGYDTFNANWEFPGWMLTYWHRGFSNFHHLQSRPRHHGIAFYGKQGTLVVDRYGYELYANAVDERHGIYDFPVIPPEETMDGVPYGGRDGSGEQDGAYQQDFLDCIKEKKQPLVSLEDSHRATVVCLLGNIAYHTRRRVDWDAVKETIPGDREASAMLDRARRKGYELPRV